MAEVALDRPILESEWEALEDPDGGRFEIIDGQLVVTPSGDADHSRYGEDLADILRRAVKLAGLSLPVTCDVEWRTVAADVVTQAPRGDVVVGTRLDPEKGVHAEVPLLVVEIWSARTRPSVRQSRRAYWASCGVRHYWEVQLAQGSAYAHVAVHDLVTDTLEHDAVGWDMLVVQRPFPVEVTPALIHGWAERESDRADEATALAHQEAARADEATALAQQEAARADEATALAQQERSRADAAEQEVARLRKQLER